MLTCSVGRSVGPFAGGSGVCSVVGRSFARLLSGSSLGRSLGRSVGRRSLGVKQFENEDYKQHPEDKKTKT